jgi:acetolactate decarboxylase
MTVLPASRRARALATAVVMSLLAAIVPAAAASAEDAAPARQVGTYAYLVTPDYDGLLPVAAAARGLTLGLGTFDRLDGELVLVGGRVYRVGTDGRPVEVTDDRLTPFFTGVRFRPTASVPVPPGTACADLGRLVTQAAGTASGMVAVRVRGTFTDLVARSVPAQAEPYPALATVVAGQTVFPLPGSRAVLVGFWTGADLAGVGAPGLHLHGVTADRSAGGHVLSCIAGGDVQLSVEPLDGVTVVTDLPAE